MKSLRWFLGFSMLANLVLGVLYWRRPELPPIAPAPTTVSEPTPPRLQMENDQFDFSQTSLSDESWKIEVPELPPAPVADSAQ